MTADGLKFVASLFPVGANDKPDNHVISFYINMRELREAKAILSALTGAGK